MKKFILTLLALGLLISPVLGADKWAKDEPLGTQNVSDIDTLIGVNNEAIDRMVGNYHMRAKVEYLSATTLNVAIGSVSCSNAAGTIRQFRNNTSATTVAWTDIDTGAEANSTTYYVYAVCDADATTFTVIISANASTPQGGETYYAKIGSFYNNASGDIDRSKVYDRPGGSLKSNSSGQGFIADIRDYASSSSSYTAKDQWDLKIAYGNAGGLAASSSVQITNLPFTSANTFRCSAVIPGTGTSSNHSAAYPQSSSTASVYNGDTSQQDIDWICIGY